MDYKKVLEITSEDIAKANYGIYEAYRSLKAIVPILKDPGLNRIVEHIEIDVYTAYNNLNDIGETIATALSLEEPEKTIDQDEEVTENDLPFN